MRIDMNDYMIYAFITLGIFLLAVGLTYVSLLVARATNFHDSPDEYRKLHDLPTPTAGGIAIGISYLLGAIWAFNSISSLSSHLGHFMWYFFFAGGVIFFTGLFDDMVGLQSRNKFLLQILAAGIILMGIRNEYLVQFPGYQTMSWVATAGLLLIFGFWLISTTNMINLIDGVDALAASISLTIIAGLSVIAAFWDVFELGVILYPLAAAIAGFLLFNKPPAKIFMGDTGSLLIGFSLGTATLVMALKSPHWYYSFTLILLFSVPVADTFLSILRRLKRGMSPFESDNSHIHHILQRYYKSPRLTVFSLVAVSTIFSLTAVLLANTSNLLLYFMTLTVIALIFGAVTVAYLLKLDNAKSIVNDDLALLLKRHMKTEGKFQSLNKLPNIDLPKDKEYANTFKN